MKNLMKIYEENLDLLNAHLDFTMKEIEIIQKQEVLDKDSKALIALLMEQYASTNTNIECFEYKVKNYRKKIIKEEEA